MTDSLNNSKPITWLGSGTVMEERNKPLVCKFVILLNTGAPVLIYAPVEEYDYHAKLVNHYCDLNDIPACWARKPDLVELLDGEISLAGGGWLKLSSMCESVEVYGSSTAYGKFDPDLLNKLIVNEPFCLAKSLKIR